MKYYLDSSLIVSFILEDATTLNFIKSNDGELFTSKLGRSEVIRSIKKFDIDKFYNVETFFRGVTLLEISDDVLEIVEGYSREITLKTSDAIHVATASLLLEDDDCLVTLDKQMATNAERLGIRALAL